MSDFYLLMSDFFGSFYTPPPPLKSDIIYARSLRLTWLSYLLWLRWYWELGCEEAIEARICYFLKDRLMNPSWKLQNISMWDTLCINVFISSWSLKNFQSNQKYQNVHQNKIYGAIHKWCRQFLAIFDPYPLHIDFPYPPLSSCMQYGSYCINLL